MFPMADCADCAKAVLTYVALDDSGNEIRRCARCDGAIDGGIRWTSAPELEAAGYEIGYRPEKAGGCGCGSGGCSMRSGDKPS